jgi:hypothetical protein
MLKSYAALAFGAVCICISSEAGAQTTGDTGRQTCAALLSNDASAGAHLGPGDSLRGAPDTASRARADSASFGVGGARNGAADVMLLVGVHADQVTFARQPNVRIRLCWGGDTVRVVQRDNLPSPVVAGTTYRNVYVAVELVGRVNAECLAEQLGVGANAAARNRPANSGSNGAAGCAFLGGSAAAGAPSVRPPVP